MSTALHVASWALLVAGGVFCVIGTLGLVRLHSFFPRTHAASVIDSAGAGLIWCTTRWGNGIAIPSRWKLCQTAVLTALLRLMLSMGLAIQKRRAYWIAESP